MSDTDLIRDTLIHIEALQALLAAMRVGRRTPEKALDTLDRTASVPRRLQEALAATPAPLDGPYTVSKIEYAADDIWDVLDANGEKIALCGEADARMIAAALNAATPAPLPIEPYERECMVRDAEKGVAPAGSSMTRAEWDRRYLLERLAELRGGR